MKVARITSLLILSLIIVVACNSKAVKKYGQPPAGIEEKRDVAYILQGKHYEECIELYSNQVLHYSFNSSQDVDFNIHYHSMEGRKYAIKKNKVTYSAGELVCNEMSFYDKDQENFCMMWSNHGETEARLSLKYYVTTSPAPEEAK